MYKTVFIILSLISSINIIFSQSKEIPIQREFQNAINKASRTLDGKPGQNYWQNEIDYKIEATFDAESGKLTGKEIIKYKNNSPSTLYNLLINLYPNLFQKGNLRDRAVNIDDVHSGMKLKSISINNKNTDPHGYNCQYEGTHLKLRLPKPLYRKDEVTLEIEWEFVMQSKTFIRVGKYGDKTWFIGYWYPQIAVYDDLFGWDDLPYDGLHEFYSPFANFDVKLTSNSEQIIWATGLWQNPDSILEEKYLKNYKKALKSKKVVHIVEAKDLGEKITKGKTNNTWHFIAENVTDFSFATSNNYLWDGLSLVVDKKTKRETFIQTAYNKKSLDFYDVAKMSKETIKYLSDSMPGIPFPYPGMTVFNGGGGMEFPMMVNDRSCNTTSATLNLTSHEIAHTYFPFYMGINQERFSWMDEGWAQFLPAEFQEQQLSYNEQAAYSANVYGRYAGTNLEVPMMIPTHFMKGYEYYIDSYYRPEIAYRTLQDLLGKDLFLKCLQEYIKRWNGKYPCPYDFFFTFDDVAGKDLSWFWKPWFFEIAYPDLAIVETNENKEGLILKIQNKGGLPLPIVINIIFEDNTTKKIIKPVDIWENGDKTISVLLKPKLKIKEISIGNSRIPDSFKGDNTVLFEGK